MKRIMQEKGITGAALAEKTGFSKAAVSQYINDINRPSQGRIEAIASALGVTVDDLEGFPGIPVAGDGVTRRMPGLYKNKLRCEDAAALMHKSVDYVRKGLREGRKGFEFGSAVKTSTRWSYCIYANKFTEITGIPIDGIQSTYIKPNNQVTTSKYESASHSAGEETYDERI